MFLRYRRTVETATADGDHVDLEAYAPFQAHNGRMCTKLQLIMVSLTIAFLVVTYVSDLYDARVSRRTLNYCTAMDAEDRGIKFAKIALWHAINSSASNETCSAASNAQILVLSPNASYTLAILYPTLRDEKTEFSVRQNGRGSVWRIATRVEISGVAQMLRAETCVSSLREIRMADVTLERNAESTTAGIKLVAHGPMAACAHAVLEQGAARQIAAL